MSPSLTEISSSSCFGGQQKVFSHDSTEVKCKMSFGVYLPPHVANGQPLPVVYFLSGLTCSEANFIQKSGFQRVAAALGLIVVNPDTSPRGCQIEGETDSWDFGAGAGFYVDATVDKWKAHYRMYSYVTNELPRLIKENFSVSDKAGIFGHSMGGHGALICALKNPRLYTSVSAFAPICNPVLVPWGQKAFQGYLGSDREQWKQWDATYLAQAYAGPKLELLVDQGSKDEFLPTQLLPENLKNAVHSNSEHLSITLRMQEGYDHGYFFVSTFIEEHLKHHAKYITA